MFKKVFAALLYSCVATASAADFVPVWTRAYSSSANSTGVSISIAPDGNIIAAGTAQDYGGKTGYLVLKYSPDGQVIWSTLYASPSGQTNQLAAATFDPDGNILLAGSSDTVKFDPQGRPVWAAQIASGSIACNREFAYVTGASDGAARTIQLGNNLPDPVDMILDADPGQDIDDLSDLAIANNLMSRGEINLLAVMGAHQQPFIAEAIQIMNRYYGHTNIPVAVATNGPTFVDGYDFSLVLHYGARIGYNVPVPEAAQAYRAILASRPDHSVTIQFTGQLRNLLNLWNSGPDESSSLFGPALLERKVKRLVVVAGIFPDSFGGGEYNLATDAEAARVLNNITNSIPVTFVGIEQGDPVLIPAKGIAQLDPDNPVRYIYDAAQMTNRASWSGLGFLYAARGEAWRGATYFQTFSGRAMIAANGADRFESDPEGNQAYVRKMQSDDRFIEMLDDLLLQPPGSMPHISGDRSGRELWSHSFDGLTFTNGRPQIVQLDQYGDAFVAGVGVAGSTMNDRPIGSFVLQHYGEAGRLRWTVQPTNSLPPAPEQVRLCDMAVTNDGVWLFGQYGAGGALFKFDQQGNQLWSFAASESATASRMLLDNVGNAYLVHSSTNAITVTRVDPNGNLVDESTYPIPAGQTMTVQAVAMDSHGRFYLGGGRTDQSGHAAMMFLRFDPQISAFSLTTDDHTLAAAGSVKALAIDPSGDVYVTGYLASAAGRSILVTARYTSALQMDKLPDGPLRLRYVTAPQQPLTLEATQDFVDWRAIATNRADATGFVQFEDADAATLPLRFYRTRTDTSTPAP